MSLEPTDPSPAADPPTGGIPWRRRLAALDALLSRLPWLLPALSFGAGWFSFAMVERGAGLARLVALLAIIGWPWLLIEPLVRRYLERRSGHRFAHFAINFVTQSLQQELLFFSLPLVLGATQADPGQIIFAGLTGLAALVSTIDPLYSRHIARRAPARLAFQIFCSWVAALVVLPIVVQLPLERALPLSLALVAVWMMLALPYLLAALPGRRQRTLWLMGLLAAPLLVWMLRDHIPAAGLSVREARIARSIEGLTPGPEVQTISAASLGEGVVAYAAIRAPMGLAQAVVFDWRHGDFSERIPAEIHGGSSSGWRTFSRKRVFPADALGRWTVDIRTPQGQLIERMRFTVVQN
jgi:hypothetical protein